MFITACDFVTSAKASITYKITDRLNDIRLIFLKHQSHLYIYKGGVPYIGITHIISQKCVLIFLHGISDLI